MKFQQPIRLSRDSNFVYNGKSLEVINTVFANVCRKDIPVDLMTKDEYQKDGKNWRSARRRFIFRRDYLYPSMKKSGIVDPLIIQFITNVPKELGGFRCLIGNNRLTAMEEYSDIAVDVLPCFVINIRGNGTDFQEPLIQGEVIDSEEKARNYYNGKITYIRYIWNDNHYLIDLRIKRFRGEY